jgi:MarR family transcriptional regulator, organic hydroperoxide resistance regulator
MAQCCNTDRRFAVSLDNCRSNDYCLFMAGKIQKEIKQGKPIAGLGEEAYLNILRTADLLSNEVAAVLKPAGLTLTQYNVLRILRGAHPDHLTCSQLGERLISRDPDITRLIDRLETRGLLVHKRHDEDRRIVTVRITDQGLTILKDLDEPVRTLHRRQLGRLGAADLEKLISLLELARDTG